MANKIGLDDTVKNDKSMSILKGVRVEAISTYFSNEELDLKMKDYEKNILKGLGNGIDS